MISTSANHLWRRWAALGLTLRQPSTFPIQATPCSFNKSFAGLIQSASALHKLELRALEHILDQSRRQLSPLGKPLEQSFGLNRWLSGAREEAYSDWLHWLFSEMTIDELSNTLGIRELSELDIGTSVIGEREIWIGSPDDGLGRLDIFMKFGNQAFLVIELKKGDADESAVEQLVQYRNTLLKSPDLSGCVQLHILLSKTAPAAREGIKIRDYAKFCRNLRRLAMQWTAAGTQVPTGKQLQAAAVLMVGAAIEANLLGMSARKESYTPSLIEHLGTFVASAEYERWEGGDG